MKNQLYCSLSSPPNCVTSDPSKEIKKKNKIISKFKNGLVMAVKPITPLKKSLAKGIWLLIFELRKKNKENQKKGHAACGDHHREVLSCYIRC